MGSSKRAKARSRAGSGAAPLSVAETLRTDPHARRVASLALRHLAGWSVAAIRKELNGITKTSLDRWGAGFVESPKLARKRRKGVYVLKEADISLTQSEVSKPRGHRPATPLTSAIRKLKASNAVPPAHRTTFSRALKRDGWCEQAVKAVVPLNSAAQAARVAFARREGRVISEGVLFTDSKIFPMVPDRSTRLGRAWAPAGQPVTAQTSQKSPGQVHAYGGISRHFGTDLIEVTGTRDSKNKPPPAVQAATDAAHAARRAAAAQNAGARARQAAPPFPRGVTSSEYRVRVLGTRQGGGLLGQAHRLFTARGEVGWRFQQDGAAAHSVADTVEGRQTRAAITALAPLVDDWPAHSPDLSPIEKVWAHMEFDIYSRDYATFEEFRAIVRAAWARATTPARLRSLFGGLRPTYAACVRKGGSMVEGWGSRAK